LLVDPVLDVAGAVHVIDCADPAIIGSQPLVQVSHLENAAGRVPVLRPHAFSIRVVARGKVVLVTLRLRDMGEPEQFDDPLAVSHAPGSLVNVIASELLLGQPTPIPAPRRLSFSAVISAGIDT
jgi:hypothetical protein